MKPLSNSAFNFNLQLQLATSTSTRPYNWGDIEIITSELRIKDIEFMKATAVGRRSLTLRLHA